MGRATLHLQGQSVKILVTDDEEPIREIAKELLIRAGHEVLEATDGEQALSMAYEKRPDLILLDLIMPKMTGFEFILRIGKDPQVSKIPILVMSALVSGEGTDPTIYELDVAGFIDKTEMTTSLISQVEEILSR